MLEKLLAQLPPEALENVTGQEGVGRTAFGGEAQSLEILVARVVQGMLSLLGVIFFVLVLYGGIKWMKAKGEPKEVEAAKDIITNATIGLALVLAAYAISIFVVSRIQSAVGL